VCGQRLLHSAYLIENSRVQIFDEPALKIGVVALATGNELEMLEGRIQKA